MAEANFTTDNNMTFNESVDYLSEQIAQVATIYYTPLLIFLGSIGNIACILIFFRSKMRSQSTSQYLSALAMSDTIFLIQLVPPWLNALKITGIFHTNGFCQVFVFISYVTCSLSAWLVVAFTVERFVAVLYPLRRNAMCTVRRARHIILMIAAAALLLNVPVLRFAIPTANDCNIDFNYLDHAAIFNIIDTVVSFTLPLGIIIILNSWIMVGVWRLERARQQLIKVRARTRRVARLVGCPRSQQRVTRMLLTVSTVFVVLNLPAYTMRVLAYALHRSSTEYSGRWAALQQVALMFFNTNFGINFLLYCLSGQNFRRALLQCLRRRGRDLAVRRPTAYRPARANSISTTFVSCTEATSNLAVVSVVPDPSAGAAARAAPRNRLLSRAIFNSLQGRTTDAPATPATEEIELHAYPSDRDT